jgi:8-oxo-dGTP diphosphatase
VTTESEFLADYRAEAYERPSVAVDVALLTIVDESLRVLLIERKTHPFAGRWQLPGGFVGIDESLDDAAHRVIEEKASLSDVFVEQLYTFGRPDRDPRTRIITVAYYALVEPARTVAATEDAILAVVDVPWQGEAGGPVALTHDGHPLPVAFDHDLIVGTTVKRLRGKLNYAPIGYELLPNEFTLYDLQRIHETILGVSLNKDSFRRRMLASGELAPTGNRQTEVGHRPAALYRHLTSPG